MFSVRTLTSPEITVLTLSSPAGRSDLSLKPAELQPQVPVLPPTPSPSLIILNSINEKRINAALEAIQKEAYRALLRERNALEGRVSLQIDLNHALFQDLVDLEMRRPPR